MSENELQTLVAFFKALADPSRLKIVGVLAEREASVNELAEALSLRAPTVSHHLSRLRALGLVAARAEGNARYYRLCPEVLEQMSRRVLAPGAISQAAAPQVDADAYDRKVLRAFVDGERLVAIPASRRKRAVILRWLVERFTPGVELDELQVNAIIKAHHPDCATLRRELVGAGLLTRDRGVYVRPAPADPAAPTP